MKKENHYILFIDDSGSRFPDVKAPERKDGMDCFALGGVLILEKDIKESFLKYQDFCNRWSINYPLHSTKIRGFRGDFNWLKEDAKNNQNFHSDLENFLIELPVVGFASVIDRKGYNVRYHEKYNNQPWWMCKTAYATLIERVTKFVMSNNGTFSVYFEQVGKKEDNALKEYTKSLKNEGMPFNQSSMEKYNIVSSQDFSKTLLGDAREHSKESFLIQVADLYLYPMIKRKFDNRYKPWLIFYSEKRVIDALVDENDCDILGIKYSCFDSRIESKKSE